MCLHVSPGKHDVAKTDNGVKSTCYDGAMAPERKKPSGILNRETFSDGVRAAEPDDVV